MPSVLIAGGTSKGLGQTIVRGVLAHAPDWKPIVLSRPGSKPPAWLAPLLSDGKVDLRHADYSNKADLTAALHGVHTVISVLFTGDETWTSTQITLLQAAKEARVTRFAPSEFGVGIDATHQIDGLAGNAEVWKACEASGLEWTRFVPGLFMNYLGFAAANGRREDALGGRENDGEWTYFSSKRQAEIPVKVDGSFPRITMTAMEDIGKYVAKSLDLENWETVSSMAGDTLRMDEVVRIAEKVMGEKWTIKTLSPAELNKQIEAEEDFGKKLWLQLALMYTRDAEGEGVVEPQLNGMFPDIEPLSVEKYMQKYYA